MRTRWPARRTLPSSTAPTPSSSAIWVIFLVVFLYLIDDVREMTLSALTFESCMMMSSVDPVAGVLVLRVGTHVLEGEDVPTCRHPTLPGSPGQHRRRSPPWPAATARPANCEAVLKRSAGTVAMRLPHGRVYRIRDQLAEQRGEGAGNSAIRDHGG